MDTLPRLGSMALLVLGWMVTSSEAARSIGPGSVLSAIDFRTSRVGWIGANGRIWGTSDGGGHWVTQYTGSQGIVAFDFVGLRVGWALGTSSLLATTDGGRHWVERARTPHPLTDVTFTDRTRGWGIEELRGAARQDLPPQQGQLVRTSDGGRSWTEQSKRLPAQSVCFADSLHGWVANHTEVVRTSDGGRTWRVSLAAPLRYSPEGWFATVQCTGRGAWVLFQGATGASNQDPYVAFRYTGGAWRPMFDEPFFFQSYTLSSAIARGPGNYPGPFTVLNGDSAWFLGRDYVHNGIGVLGTMDGGKTWIRAVLRRLDPESPNAVSFPSRQQGWVVGNSRAGGVVLVTRNGGRTWERSAGPR